MKLTPWRRRELPRPRSFDLDDVWNRFFDGNGSAASHLPEVFQARPVPPVDVSETEDGYKISVDCPGPEADEIDIEAMGHSLLISGERKWEEETEEKDFRRVERQYGKFQRTIPLPENARVTSDAIEASYKRGVLTVRVPKTEPTPAARIQVRAE